MAVIHLEFGSEKLGMKTRANVVLPEKPTQKLQTLLLFHGLGDDENSWLEQTNLISAVNDMQLAVIMPRVDKSYYTNTLSGMNYFDYVSEELLERSRKWFPLSTAREDNFVGGVSMGGFGALKTGLTYPEKFSAILAFSAMTDQLTQWGRHPEREAWYRDLFGSPSQIKDSVNDLASLLSKQDPNLVPFIWQLCGTEDPFYEMNQKFANLMSEKKVAHQTLEVPGAHEWSVWRQGIEQAMEFLKTRTTNNIN
ncbi:alpha/beta hydrolase [Ligilactobacillus acidipiscis]|uniref:alpha/beta hydrolase n=1 Tax=Ligilactobacillus acidipiscis TaxID=89059 RepID=UPI0023F7C987|nr:alpha/beta hydrolase-fold protein [Ligilactobacillus acidipiscis]WEV57050.1 alpha/beta hydrolase-fold protein [Ligilactobacillus acidipiscis]